MMSPVIIAFPCLTLGQVDNHLHIDLAGAVLPRTSSSYQRIRRDLRAVVFKALAECTDTFEHM